MVLLVSVFAVGIAASLADTATSRSAAYGVSILGALAVAGWIGFAWDVPTQTQGETFIRTLAIVLPSFLLGVRIALGRKPTETHSPD